MHHPFQHDNHESADKKLIHTVSSRNPAVTANHSLLATRLLVPGVNPQDNPFLDNGWEAGVQSSN